MSDNKQGMATNKWGEQLTAIEVPIVWCGASPQHQAHRSERRQSQMKQGMSNWKELMEWTWCPGFPPRTGGPR